MTSLLELDDLDLGLGVATSTPTEAPAPAPETPPTTTRRRGPAKSKGLFFFDLETIPDYDRMDLFDLEPLPTEVKRATVEEMGNDLPSVVVAKTVEKITDILEAKSPCEEYLAGLEKMESSREKGPRDGVMKLIKKIRGLDDARIAALAAQKKKMALCPEMNRIVAYGWKASGGNESHSMVVGDGETDVLAKITEVEILEHFWSVVPGSLKVIGFNILGFDLPTIFLRSILLGVKPSRKFDLKPWGNDCIDLQACRYPKFNNETHGLKWLARSMGIEIPAGDVDGSQVEALYDSDPAKVGEYVRSDVDLAEAIYERYSGFFC